ncbi:sugar phosphate isomerase/epimerase family protein [Microbacterium stercoris]|uniref:sugar phosphate isomerase/epimerase family protein n=1 Tax=Microbacterium stercoris TaxID=2820289 RepID=UPI001F338EB9|nr:sugar phosphate isomerase/epimerase [Microbacterium stercoris]
MATSLVPADELSVQLYTVREHLAQDLPATLGRLAEIGYRNVEPFGLTDRADQLAEHLPAFGLSAPTTHVHLVGEDVDLEGVFAAAKKVGVSTIIDPHVPEANWTTREGIERTAAALAAIADRAADHGLRVGYHNHAFELEHRIDGVSALEVFAAAAPEQVVLQVDTYWAEVGGEPAPELLRRLGDRVVALHVKDGPRTKADKDQVGVGDGILPIADILAAAPGALRVVELDDHSGDVFEAVARSFAFLTGGRA